MFYRYIIILWAVLLLAGCQTAIPSLDIEALSRSVVRITIKNERYGTGWILDEERIITAAHGPKLGEVVSITFRDGEVIKGTVTWADRKLDLAVILASIPSGYIATQLSCNPLLSGQPVVVIGHPLRMYWTVSFGYITAVDLLEKPGVKSVFAAMQLPSAVGMSGAPIFNVEGKVIGMALGWMSGRNNRTTGFSYMLMATAICKAGFMNYD